MTYIQFYENNNYTTPWRVMSCNPITYTSIDSGPSTITVSGKTYKFFNGYGSRLRNATIPNVAFFISTNRAGVPTEKRFYCKNGFSVDITENTTGTRGRLRNARIDNTLVSGQVGSNDNNYGVIGISFVYQNVTYIGFSRFLNITEMGTTTVVEPYMCFEEDFWKNAFRPPYEYGTKPDEGGQATGKIDHSNVGRSTVAPNTFPTGAQGFHAYIITPTGLDELQGSLWGEGSTLAKSLWQKFLNSKHNPIHCIVGCYRLPTRFMPLRLQSSGVHLGGVNIPISSGNCYTTQLRIYTLPSISTGIVDAPFDSWLDYYGVSVKMSIPFCGTITAPAEKIFGKSVSVSYRVDQANGNFAALVYTGNYDYILGELTGNVAYNIPVCGGDDGTLARLGAIASNVVSLADSFMASVQNSLSGRPMGTETAGLSRMRNLSDIVVPPFTTQVANCNMAGSVAACTNGIFYVEYLYANVAYAGYKEGNSQSNYAQSVGYPSYAGGTVGNFRGGYGEFYVIPNGWDVTGATAQEKNEIISLLETGVYV